MPAKRQPGERARAVALKNLTPLINELHDLSQDLTREDETAQPEQVFAIADEVHEVAAEITKVANAWQTALVAAGVIPAPPPSWREGPDA